MADIDKLEGILLGVEKTLDKLDKILFGNGQPGVVDRLAKVEMNMVKLSEAMLETKSVNRDDILELKEMIKDLACSVSTLSRVVESNNEKLIEHVKDKEVHTLKGLVLNRISLLYVVGGFLVLHALLPTDLSLGDVLLKWLGIK